MLGLGDKVNESESPSPIAIWLISDMASSTSLIGVLKRVLAVLSDISRVLPLEIEDLLGETMVLSVRSQRGVEEEISERSELSEGGWETMSSNRDDGGEAASRRSEYMPDVVEKSRVFEWRYP